MYVYYTTNLCLPKAGHENKRGAVILLIIDIDDAGYLSTSSLCTCIVFWCASTFVNAVIISLTIMLWTTVPVSMTKSAYPRGRIKA